MRNELYFDGGARPTNPGHAGFAAVLNLPNGQVRTKARSIGWGTNNMAEYMGLVVGLKLATDYMDFSRGIDIYTDSKMVWGHMTQGWERNNDRLRILIREAELLLHKHWEDDDSGEKWWDIHWIPRKENSIADELCTKVINKYRESNPSPFSVRAGVL